MITTREDIAYLVRKIRGFNDGEEADDEAQLAEQILNHLSQRSSAREREYLTLAQAGWGSARVLAVANLAPATERASIVALERIEARLKELEAQPSERFPAEPATVPETAEAFAAFIASMLMKDQLVKLSELLDGDGDDDFNTCIQAETQKVAPELFADPDAGLDKSP